MNTRAGKHIYYQTIIQFVTDKVANSSTIKDWCKKLRKMTIETPHDLQKVYQAFIQDFKKELSLNTSQKLDKTDKLEAIFLWKIAITYFIKNIILNLLLKKNPDYLLAGEIYGKLVKLKKNWKRLV